jgi:NADP-dependent 3-hydroxy acid dehydrogenase YdfG
MSWKIINMAKYKGKCAMDLKGKVAFVTGGSGDVGGAIVRVLATLGVDVGIS